MNNPYSNEDKVMFSVILPVKNEPNLPDFLSRLHGVVSDLNVPYEIIVAMGDREKEWTEPLQHPNQRVIKTYGDTLERSIIGGFSHAKGRKIMVCDADDCHPIEKIPEIFYGLDDYEMVVGSRYIAGGKSDLGAFRNFISWMFGKWAKFWGSKLSDPMVGFFGIRREVLDRVQFKPFTWKIPLEIELKARPTFMSFPVTAKGRTIGKTKTTVKIGLKIAWELFVYGCFGK